MNPLFLTDVQRVELTARQTRRGQISWLKENGIAFALRADGWPVVATAAVLARLAPGATAAQDDVPNFEALRTGSGKAA